MRAHGPVESLRVLQQSEVTDTAKEYEAGIRDALRDLRGMRAADDFVVLSVQDRSTNLDRT